MRLRRLLQSRHRCANRKEDVSQCTSPNEKPSRKRDCHGSGGGVDLGEFVTFWGHPTSDMATPRVPPRERTTLDVFTYAVVEDLERMAGIAERGLITTKELADYGVKQVEEPTKARNASQEPCYEMY
jgi:hypothetical protein